MIKNEIFKNSKVKSSQEYTSEDFLFRLYLVQTFLKKANLDSILVINGFFGENNKESTKFTNWLLKGYSGHTLFHNLVEEDKFEESIIVVGQNSLGLYLEPKGMNLIREKLLACKNCRVFVPDKKQFEDKDFLENLKLKEFYRFVHQHKKIGVPFEGEEDDVKSIEKWPIIRAYAIDGIAGGFFTLLHQVVNVTKFLNSKLYSYMDKHSKLYQIETHSKKMANNIKLAVSSISNTEQKRKCSELDQSELSELFAETFELAELNRGKKIDMTLPLPAITFGINTSNKLVYKEKPKAKPVIGKVIVDNIPALTPQTAFIQNSGHIEGKNALHCVMENVEALGMNRCARTYFLTSNAPKIQKVVGVENFAGYITTYELEIEKDPMFLDEYKLTTCYLKVLQTYLKLAKNLRMNLKKSTIEKAKEAMLNKIKGLNSKLNKKHSGETSEDIEISIKYYDLLGSEFDFYEHPEMNPNQYILVLRLEVHNIHSVLSSDKIIGSLVISDSFLIMDKFVFNLTQEVPYFDFFEARPDFSQPIRDMVELYAGSIFGERKVKLCGDLDVYLPFIEGLDTNIIDFPVFQAQVSWFEHTLKFHSDKVGCFLLMNDDLVKVEFYRMSIDNLWAIFHLKENIFFPKLTRPMICVKFSKTAMNEIYVGLKSHYDEQKIETVDLKIFPDYLRKSVNLRDNGFLKEGEFMQTHEEEKKTLVDTKDDFMQIMALYQCSKMTSNGESKLKYNNVMEILKENANEEIDFEFKFEEDKVDVMLLIGPLGSSKRGFIDEVHELRERFPLPGDTLVSFLTYSDEDLAEMTTDDFIQNLEESIGDGDDQVPPGNGLILMVVPHTCDHLKVIRHIDESQSLRLRTVFSKLNLYDYVTKNQQSIDNLAYYFEPGFNYFCFLDTENVEKGFVYSKVNVFKKAFPYVDFRTIESNEINYSKFVHIIKSKVYLSKTSRYLRSLNSDNYTLPYSCLYLNYRIPIRRDLLDNLKELIYDHEGALLVPEKKEEIKETIEVREERKKNLGRVVKDELAEEIKKLKRLLRGVKALENDKICQIHRIKGLMRFEGEIEKGIFCIYLNPFAEWIQDFEVETKVQNINKNGLVLHKATYEDFQADELGFYIYGKNLDRKELIRWFNRNMITQLELEEIRTRENLTMEEIKQAEKGKESWGLSRAVIFDGRSYRDRMGEYLKHHPRREEILKDYITERNQEIKKENELKKKKEIYRRKFYQNY